MCLTLDFKARYLFLLLGQVKYVANKKKTCFDFFKSEISSYEGKDNSLTLWYFMEKKLWAAQTLS